MKRAEAELGERRLAIEEAGSIAEAALKLNGVFQAAQTAADDYLWQCRQRADELLAEAERKREEAQKLADEILAGARQEADRIYAEARAAGSQGEHPKSVTGEPQPTERKRGWPWGKDKA